ncbi:C40 family peptidase [Hydrogenophaga sp. 5NK40-0174]|uniref:C40 family peptidase n=1 Tax=Hydrogenophaga sp. 5NK40-0174 TaxID=3127649 RepID=UPI00310B92EA
MKFVASSLLLILALSVNAEPVEQPFNSMEALLSSHGLAGDRHQETIQTASVSMPPAGGDYRSPSALVVMNAMAYLGTPYQYGGNTVETGFDCSGFVRAVFSETLGKNLPRRSHQQADHGASVGKQSLQPGDLVFFNTQRRRNSHVGIYIGDGRFVHAPRTGARVRVEDMNVSYWSRRYDGARRLTGEGESTGTLPEPNHVTSEPYEFSMVPDLAF